MAVLTFDKSAQVMVKESTCLDGGIGRHPGLKIPWPQGRAGSIPALGTKHIKGVTLNVV